MQQFLVLKLVVAALCSGMSPSIAKDVSPTTAMNSAECMKGVELAISRLSKGSDHFVIHRKAQDLRDMYSDYPVGRPYKLILSVNGEKAVNVMNSPVLLTSISTQIIENCDLIGAIDIGVHRTDYITTFGLMNEGSIQEFQCTFQNVKNPVRFPLSWGYMVCLGRGR